MTVGETLIASHERHARDLDSAPGPSRKPVKVRVAGAVCWCGRQWAATDYGVEALDGSYPIEAARLWEDEDTHGWVRHMADKNWVDLADFAEALRIARGHARRRGIPPVM